MPSSTHIEKEQSKAGGEPLVQYCEVHQRGKHRVLRTPAMRSGKSMCERPAKVKERSNRR